jgi:hypothetical protein
MARPGIRKANADYERWLRRQLRGEMVEKDLREKHDKMSSGAFPFLRATYWRWAETILDICPELADAPQVLAIGDIHLENYGTWRDDDGRLIWGVNDFDEAAVMPYTLDLVRLATSATLAQLKFGYNVDVCGPLLSGYSGGLTRPCPFVMDEGHAWLRDLLVVKEKKRKKFWRDVDAEKASKDLPPERCRSAISAAMPEAGIAIDKYYSSQAGTGSLGRPRWVGVTEWRGGRVLREAKALVPSGWTRARGLKTPYLQVQEIANGRYRAPDPWYSANDRLVVRRLSPNNRKIQIEKEPDILLRPAMLTAMGHELANIHIGTGDHRSAIKRDLLERKKRWLRDATAAATAFVVEEYEKWSGKPAAAARPTAPPSDAASRRG